MNRRYDLHIRNALIAGRPGRTAGIGLVQQARAEHEIDERGKIAAPGFIDAPTRHDRLLGSDPATKRAGNSIPPLFPCRVDGSGSTLI